MEKTDLKSQVDDDGPVLLLRRVSGMGVSGADSTLVEDGCPDVAFDLQVRIHDFDSAESQFDGSHRLVGSQETESLVTGLHFGQEIAAVRELGRSERFRQLVDRDDDVATVAGEQAHGPDPGPGPLIRSGTAFLSLLTLSGIRVLRQTSPVILCVTGRMLIVVWCVCL